MGMHVGIEQRLEQRLEQRIAVLMVTAIRTKEDEKNDKNNKALKKFKEKLKNYDPSLPAEKVDLSCLDKDLQAPFQLIKDKATVQDINALCDIGLYANETGYSIDGTFDSFSSIAKSVDDKLQVVRLGSSLMQREHDVSLTYNSLSELAKDETFKDVMPLAVLEAFEARTFPEEFKGLFSKTRLTLDSICEGFDYIKELDELSLGLYNREIELGAEFLANPEHVKYQDIPLPIRAHLISMLSEERMQQANEIFGQKHLRKSTDAKRRMYRAINSLERHPQGKEVLDHMFTHFKSAEEIEKISSQLELLLQIGSFAYYFEETDGKKLLTRLQNEIFLRALKRLNLSEKAREKLSHDPNRLLAHDMIGMISTYSSIIDSTYREGLPLLTEITEHVIEGDFKEWRYSNGISEKQLEFIANAKEIWKQNKSSSHIIGDVKGIEPTINVLHKISQDLKEEYQKSQKIEGSKERLKQVEDHVNKIVMQMMQGTAPHGAVAQKEELVRDHNVLSGIVRLESASSENISGLETIVTSAVRSTTQEQMKMLFQQALQALSQPTIKNLHKINVVETDEPYRLFDVGKNPVQSCQRWNEQTGYNKCLLAYVADANKKLYLVQDSYGRTIARSIVRLMPLDKETPMLLIERPYATSWTPDYGISILRSAMEKAAEISKVIGREVAVASTAPEYTNLIKEISKTQKSKVYRKSYSAKLVPSINGFEYSDTFRSTQSAGMHKSGEKVSAQINYIFVNSSN